MQTPPFYRFLAKNIHEYQRFSVLLDFSAPSSYTDKRIKACFLRQLRQSILVKTAE